VRNLKRILVELAVGLVLVGTGLAEVHRGECFFRLGSYSSGNLWGWSVRQVDSPAVFSSCIWYTFGSAAVCFVFCLMDVVFALAGEDDS